MILQIFTMDTTQAPLPVLIVPLILLTCANSLSLGTVCAKSKCTLQLVHISEFFHNLVRLCSTILEQTKHIFFSPWMPFNIFNVIKCLKRKQNQKILSCFYTFRYHSSFDLCPWPCTDGAVAEFKLDCFCIRSLSFLLCLWKLIAFHHGSSDGGASKKKKAIIMKVKLNIAKRSENGETATNNILLLNFSLSTVA